MKTYIVYLYYQHSILAGRNNWISRNEERYENKVLRLGFISSFISGFQISDKRISSIIGFVFCILHLESHQSHNELYVNRS